MKNRVVCRVLAVMLAEILISVPTAAEEKDPRFKYKEPVTLTSYFEIDPIISDWEHREYLNGIYYQRMEEETNISIDWKWFAQQTDEDAVRKKNVAIASGEIPDFMLTDSVQLLILAQSDLINRDIGRIFQEYASEELMAWTAGEGSAAMESAFYNGEMIAIPLVKSSMDAADMLWIRRDWLEKLNLEVPTTMDELYDVMLAFRDRDPDGNGKKDTIGMVLHDDFLTVGVGDAVGLFNGFGAYPGQWVEDAEGNLIYGSVCKENKEALAYLARMYREGLIEDNFASMDMDTASKAVTFGKAGIQYGLMWDEYWPLNASVQCDSEADWVAVPIPGSDKGPAKPQIELGVDKYVVVSKRCEHPEAVVRMLNYWVDTYAYSGEEYQDYLVRGRNGALFFPENWIMLKTYDPLRNLTMHRHIVSALESKDASDLTEEELTIYNDCLKYLSGDIVGGYSGMKTFGNDMSAFGVIEYYYDNNLFMPERFLAAPTKTMTAKMSAVTEKVTEYYTKVILGEASTEEFEDFVKEVNILGLKKITEEVNEWYASTK